jgi:hypothetical protein
MQRKHILVVSTIALLAVFAVACSGTNAAPNRTRTLKAGPRANADPGAEGGFRGAPTTAPVPVPNSSQSASTDAGSSSAATFETQTVEGGSVSVAVTPISLKAGAPGEFEIARWTSRRMRHPQRRFTACMTRRGNERDPSDSHTRAAE